MSRLKIFDFVFSYTSLGDRSSTLRNPLLFDSITCKFLPSHCLKNDNLKEVVDHFHQKNVKIEKLLSFLMLI